MNNSNLTGLDGIFMAISWDLLGFNGIFMGFNSTWKCSSRCGYDYRPYILFSHSYSYRI